MSAKRKIRLGAIDADPDQFALVVNYTTEIHHVDEFGCPSAAESQPGQKTIRLPRGLAGLDIPALAQEVVDKCKYIPASKVVDVERLLHALMEYEVHHNQPPKQVMPPQRGEPPPPREQAPSSGPPPKPARAARQEPLLPDADVRNIDEYADQLYEEKMELKVHGAKCILRVCTEAKKLGVLGRARHLNRGAQQGAP